MGATMSLTKNVCRWDEEVQRGLDPRVCWLASKQDYRDSVEVLVRAFSGADNSAPEGLNDWAIGRLNRPGPLYEPLQGEPSKQAKAHCKFIATFTAVMGRTRGMLLGVRDPATGALQGTVVLLPRNLASGFMGRMWGHLCDTVAFVRAIASAGIPPWMNTWSSGMDKDAKVRMMTMLEHAEGNHEKLMKHQPHMYVYMVAVDPAHQGKGVGSALLSAAHAISARSGLSQYLEASGAKNRAFYEKNGYETKICLETFSVPGRPDIEPYAHPGGCNFMVRPASDTTRQGDAEQQVPKTPLGNV